MSSHVRIRTLRAPSCVYLATWLTLLAGPVADCRAEDSGILIREGDKVSFLGDSITAQGAQNPAGYVRLIISGLKVNGITAVPFPAGISGNTSKDMLGRLDRDVLSKKPQWMTPSCGVNDVWHGPTGVLLDKYKENIAAIVDKAQAAGIKVVILTSTMIYEDRTNEFNKKLVEYNDFLRTLAKEKNCQLADLNADMQAGLNEISPAPSPATTSAAPHVNHFTVDGVHMNLLGQRMMAAGVLKAFGLNDAQLKKAQDSWLDIAGNVEMPRTTLTNRQYDKLAAMADKKHMTVPELIAELTSKAIESLDAAK